jgi:hypothetical protein
MIGCPQCSHYDTTLMLLHVIKSLWSHQSVLIMGRSLELSLVPSTFLRNHTTFMMRCLRHLPILRWHTLMVMVVYWKNDVSITTDTEGHWNDGYGWQQIAK